MVNRTDTFDLSGLRLTSGEGRRLELGLAIEPLSLGGHAYAVTRLAPDESPQADGPRVGAEGGSAEVDGASLGMDGGSPGTNDASPGTNNGSPETSSGSPELIPAALDISRMTGQGYALHLTFSAALKGPCMRCLGPAGPHFSVDAREVSQPGEGEDLESPYVIESILDVGAWARDALVLALPTTLLCREDCAGLCPTCGVDLNQAGADHAHVAEPDPRWAALAELTLESPESPESPESTSESPSPQE